MKIFEKKVLLVFSFFLAFASFSQVDYKKPLDAYFIPKSIKKNKIKSLVIYLEMNKDDITENGSITGKLQEIEFSSQGLTSYRLRSDNRGAPPFIAYGKGSYFEEKNYDEKGRLIHHFMEDYQITQQEVMTYDVKGNRSSLVHLGKKDTLASIGFIWEKGQLVKWKTIDHDTASRAENQDLADWDQKFDSQGRIIETTYEGIRIVHSYEILNDSLFTTMKVYHLGALASEEKYTTWIKYNLVTSWDKLDEKGNMKASMRVKYDIYGNATNYYYNEGRAVSIQIKNEYDKRKLLVSRYFYTSKRGKEKVLSRIERLVYDKKPLVYRFKRGDLNTSND
ncbi:MAG: hypothetical protein ACI8ZM_003161 [Crocinitomix sp.]|jgi:hypothetical protein